MEKIQIAQIQARAQSLALSLIKSQAERGISRAFPQPRNAAILAHAISSLLAEEGMLACEPAKAKELIFAALWSGPLMQGSTLQKAACAAGIYSPAEKLEEQYL